MTSEISCISLYIAFIFHICHIIISFDPLWNCTKVCYLENSSKVISSLAFQRIPSLQTSQQIHINNDHPWTVSATNQKKHLFNHLQPFNPVHHSKQHINAWRSWPSPAASQGLAAACAASSALPVHWEDVVERIFVLEQPPVIISFKPNCSKDRMIWGYPHFGKAPCEERGKSFLGLWCFWNRGAPQTWCTWCLINHCCPKTCATINTIVTHIPHSMNVLRLPFLMLKSEFHPGVPYINRILSYFRRVISTAMLVWHMENLETSVPSPHVTLKSQTLDATAMFSSPARWGPLDINKGVPHSLLLIPTPTHSFTASGSSPRRLGYCFASRVPNTTSPAPDAVGHAWTRTPAKKNARYRTSE